MFNHTSFLSPEEFFIITTVPFLLKTLLLPLLSHEKSPPLFVCGGSFRERRLEGWFLNRGRWLVNTTIITLNDINVVE